MRCSVFIATSADGFIARKDGNVDWLQNSGKQDVDMGADADMGFHAFMDSVDCLVMGRNTMEMIAAMDLTDDQWPYGETKIFVLSQSLQQLPHNMKARAELVSGDIPSLMAQLRIPWLKARLYRWWQNHTVIFGVGADFSYDHYSGTGFVRAGYSTVCRLKAGN